MVEGVIFCVRNCHFWTKRDSYFHFLSFFDTFWTRFVYIVAEGDQICVYRCGRGPDLCIIVAGRGLRGVCEELNLKSWWGLSGGSK